MPLYRYRCKNCGHEFEKLHEMDIHVSKQVQLKEHVTCPVCGYLPERLIGKPNAHFKGNNFTKGVKGEKN